jgi:hypothetical protein
MANDPLGPEIWFIRQRGPTPPHHLAGPRPNAFDRAFSHSQDPIRTSRWEAIGIPMRLERGGRKLIIAPERRCLDAKGGAVTLRWRCSGGAFLQAQPVACCSQRQSAEGDAGSQAIACQPP